MYTINPKAESILKEPCFELFKHADLWCCVQRVMHSGHLVGYVGVPDTHAMYGKDYSDKVKVPNIEDVKFNGNYIGLLCADRSEVDNNLISIDMALNVHCGITWASNNIGGLIDNPLGNLWWFGFDTAHAGDATPFQNEISRRYQHDDEYKTFTFVRDETKSLADQLDKLKS